VSIGITIKLEDDFLGVVPCSVVEVYCLHHQGSKLLPVQFHSKS
jgi:hypothetical protein